MTHPVATAVEPLKADAVEKADQTARRIAQTFKERLDAGHPFILPPSQVIRMGTMEYQRYKQDQNLYYQLTLDGKFHDAKIEKFIERAREDAAAQYEAFILKLTHKIGDCDAATLEGNHVWGHSILFVKKGHVVERWKTQQIVNVSKLGTLFNQWPTRKVK